jgi:hypothetical protein
MIPDMFFFRNPASAMENTPALGKVKVIRSNDLPHAGRYLVLCGGSGHLLARGGGQRKAVI